MSAIYKKEMLAYFTSPAAYGAVAAFWFFEGYFYSILTDSGSTQLSVIFPMLSSFTLFLTALITMRLFAEERRVGTDRLLFTSPLGIGSITAGKYLAALTVFVIGLLPCLMMLPVTELFAQVDRLMFVSGLVGLVLYGGAMLAIGLFVSACTASQGAAAVLTVGAGFTLMLMDYLSADGGVPILSFLAGCLAFGSRFNAFANGMIDLGNTVYFLTVIAAFLFLTAQVSRRRRRQG